MNTPTEIGGRYALERRLGAGGMSTVFLARDAVLERKVAVKLLAEHLSDDEDFVAASGVRRSRRRGSSTRTSCRCSTPARTSRRGATSSSWST